MKFRLSAPQPEDCHRAGDRGGDRIGALVFGWPSISAVIIDSVKRDEARGTCLESHFRWQIRTFWFGLLWCAIGGALFITFIGIPVALGVWLGAGLWAIYRIIRGWLALRDRRPVA